MPITISSSSSLCTIKMSTNQRAFAQKLTKHHAADVRRQIAASSYNRELSKSISNSSSFPSTLSSLHVPLCDVVEPLDYEDFIQQHQQMIDRDPLTHILQFPQDDLEVGIIPRNVRTQSPVVPEEPLDGLSNHLRDCVSTYTSDWMVYNRCYQQFSSSCWVHDRQGEKLSVVQGTPRQEFEVDMDCEEGGDGSPEGSEQGFLYPGSGRQSLCQMNDTPRGSWASFDLRNSQSDPLMPALLDRVPADTIDQNNEARRRENRQDALFSLYPPQDEDEVIERRMPSEIPCEHMGHRILVKCLQLKLELEIEPIFASMALYDAKEKKKISESFYFDVNQEPIKRMLGSHISHQDISTLSRSCIFDITYPSTDLFLVVKLEKVLQGDINDCAEPYIKDEKNRDKVKSNAVVCCERLGKYRMPFAWTAIYLMNIVTGVNSMDRDSGSEKESTGSNSLDRKSSTSSFDQFRKKSGDTGSLTRRGSLERRNMSEKRRSWSPEDFGANLDSFRPVTLTVSSFFKQESDKLRDEDLYKFLQDLKRPPSALKRLKCIPGTLRLDLSPCPEEPKYCLTPELNRLNPYPDEKGRPTKEVVEFPPREVFAPHYVYRNLLFVSPKELNFANRLGSARNIAVKVQFMAGEDENQALPNIFGKSSCPEFTNEAYTTVNYHNKTPDFYDEMKIKLPGDVQDHHHLLFTFYHVSCQRKLEQSTVETPMGYTWLPVLKDGRLQAGEFCLPVMLENPPSNYAYITPDVMLPGTKWVDNHKGIFKVDLQAISSIHAQDKYLDHFFNLCSDIEDSKIPPRLGVAFIENELKSSIQDLTLSKAEPMVKFLHLLLDKLVLLIVQPPIMTGHVMSIGQTVFEAIAGIVRQVTQLQEGSCDTVHSRPSLLTTYVTYQCTIPSQGEPHSTLGGISPPQSPGFIPRPSSTSPHRKHPRSTSNPDVHSYIDTDVEVTGIFDRGLDRTSSMRTGEPGIYHLGRSPTRKIVHEEIALQWVVSSGTGREQALQNSWFFFELMVKSIVEYLASSQQLDSPRKHRFPDHFMDDITTLITTLTSDVISRYNKDTKLIQSLNNSLAFFLHDLLSVIDRGYVFSLIKTYCKNISAKIATLPDAAQLINLKLDFIRIVCSHEHFVALNLPFGTPLTPSSASVSPSPSVASSTSQSSFISTLMGGEKNNFAELSSEFRQQHFLVGILLSDLATVLEINQPAVHSKAVNSLRNLMTCHDADPRYAQPECKARVAALYLPLVGIVMDALPQLYDWHTDNKSRPLLSPVPEESEINQSVINQTVAMAIAGTSMFGTRSGGLDNYDPFQQPRKSFLNSETTCNLLACFLWVVKNIERSALKQWWADLPPLRLHQLLEVLYICTACFEYKGKKAIRHYAQQTYLKTSDMKSKLEDVILGQGSARNEMMMRRKERNPPSPSLPGGGERLRWRKEHHLSWRLNSGDLSTERPKEEVEMDAHIEGNLAAEANMVIVDTLELLIQVVSASDNLHGLLSVVLRVLLHALARSQSTAVLQNMFATQRSLVFKFPSLLFDEETEQCADLCLRLLKHCGSCVSTVRSQASASLYLLMRQNFETGNNFARVKMQVTMSLSSLVGTNQNCNEEYLRRSLKTILVYGEEDNELQDTTFPEQVRDLVFNLHMILSDTVKMKEFQEDPEMLLDLMYRIAKGYQNSPDLRLTWLANMAQKHTERSNHAEAAMCLVHSAALVAEYLHMLEDRTYLPIGAVNFEKLSPNALEESAVSDDVVSPDEEGICTGKYFTENGLLGLLEQSASSFNAAGMYEAMNEVYKVLIPIPEANRDFKKLANIHSKLHEAFTRVDQLQGKRVFGTYFRVGFYGNKFGDLDHEEFIYKEPTLTKLPEISSRLESFYSERFDVENVIMIKDSNTVDTSKLDPEKAYIQITYVEPYFDSYEYRERVTYFNKNYNIKRFIYATPFTPDGRAHGELHEQYKRKTILTTVNHFPYVKTRIQVEDRKQVVLTPIEVAIEDIQKKTAELHLATQQEPPDPKILQMVLQGCIGTTVNQGPMEVAVVFLSELVDGQKAPSKHQSKLRLCFKDFSKKCVDALRKNKHLIGPDQRDYQRELERNYHRFIDQLMPMITINCFSTRLPRSQSSGSHSSGSNKSSPIG